MKRWKHRPEGSTWGDWGDDDQLGRLNLITPAKVLEGIAEVKEGLLKLGLEPVGGGPEVLAAKVQAELRKWTAIVREKNIRIEQ